MISYYTVKTINGDYALLVSDEGIENEVAIALLPIGTEIGSRLKWENFEYEKME